MRLRAEVDFRWKAPESGGPLQKGCGVSVDISAVGALVYAEECPPVGTAVEFVIRLPGITGLTGAVELQALGQVRRVVEGPGEAPPGRSGFAAEFKEYVVMQVA